MSTSTPHREVQEEEDSFSSLSSPMSSPPASPSAQLSNENSYAQEHSKQNDFAARSTVAAPQPNNGTNIQPQEAPVRKKPGRKPKPVDPNDPVAVKKALRNAQRTAKRQSAKEAERNNNPAPPPPPAAAQPRKRKEKSDANSKLSFGGDVAVSHQQQTKITDMGIRPTGIKQPEVPILKSNVETSQSGKSEDIPIITNIYTPSHPPPRPIINRLASGQNYDPIRSNYDPVRETVINHKSPFSTSQISPLAAQSLNRASASPSISSLVEPPNHVPQSPSHQSFFNQQARLQQHDPQTSIPPSPTHARLAPSPIVPSSKSPNPSAAMHVTGMEMPSNVFASVSTKKQVPMASASTASSSTAHSPKPPKGKDPVPPPLPGSSGGLLQGGMFGGMGAPTSDGTEFRAPTVILHIPMNGDPNKYVNFTKMAEERYGWDALHPRLAAQRDRLARVAAAGAALEKSGGGRESGDEMSLDLSEGEGSNVEMGGMSGTDGGKKPVKKRKNKEDEYDKDDGFVDDSDLLWEQQAAASKDGFFVYSGPLIPEGEKIVLDRGSDGAQKRGRGRGRGGATRATAAPRSGATPTAARGTGITRKPRITKAARQQMDLEKQERERMGLSGNFGPSMPTLASAAASAHGGTQMIFNN